MQAIDHIVFNTRDRTDEVVELFVRLGFTVGPRGHHTLGSLNHVIVFGHDYLELLGYPPGKPPERRPELSGEPLGLMATVLATADADATRSTLIERGLQPRPVQAFSRPVELGAACTRDASFRVTRLEPGAIPGTWFYYCQHQTPELVWRPEWQSHPNGVVGMSGLDIRLSSVSDALPLYQAALLDISQETVGGSHSAAAFGLRACTLRLHEQTGRAAMTGLTFAVSSLPETKELLVRAGIRFDLLHQTIVIDPDETFGATLQFEALAR